MKYIVSVRVAIILGASVCVECYSMYTAHQNYTAYQNEDMQEFLRNELCIVNDILSRIEEKYKNKFENIQADHLKSIIAPYVKNTTASVEEMKEAFGKLDRIVSLPNFLLDSPEDFTEDIESIKSVIERALSANTPIEEQWKQKREEKKEVLSDDENVLTAEKEVLSDDEIPEELYEEGLDCIQEAGNLVEMISENRWVKDDPTIKGLISDIQDYLRSCEVTVSDLRKLLDKIIVLVEILGKSDADFNIITKTTEFSEQIQAYINKITHKN